MFLCTIIGTTLEDNDSEAMIHINLFRYSRDALSFNHTETIWEGMHPWQHIVSKRVWVFQINVGIFWRLQVAVLAMDSSTSTLSTDACFNMELATGTSDNLADLLRFVSSMPVNQARSQANFTNAFIKASQLFNNTRDNTNKGMFSDNGIAHTISYMHTIIWSLHLHLLIFISMSAPQSSSIFFGESTLLLHPSGSVSSSLTSLPRHLNSASSSFKRHLCLKKLKSLFILTTWHLCSYPRPDHRPSDGRPSCRHHGRHRFDGENAVQQLGRHIRVRLVSRWHSHLSTYGKVTFKFIDSCPSHTHILPLFYFMKVGVGIKLIKRNGGVCICQDWVTLIVGSGLRNSTNEKGPKNENCTRHFRECGGLRGS